MYNISYIFVEFILYSFIGYLAEVIYCSYSQKKLVNRGFLFGPICPIYGLGAVLSIICLGSIKENPILVFILGILITSTLEYYTSYIFEKIFKNKWWDYSYRADNINGRICIGNSIYFGLGILLVIYIYNDFLVGLLDNISDNIMIIIAIILFIIFIVDLVWSIIIAYNLKSRLIIAEELKTAKLRFIPKMFAAKHKEVLSKIKFKSNRLIKNYPNLAFNLRKELDNVRRMVIDIKNVNNKKKKKK